MLLVTRLAASCPLCHAKREAVTLPPVLLQRLGLRQRSELPLERCHLEALREQAGEKRRDPAGEDEV